MQWVEKIPGVRWWLEGTTLSIMTWYENRKLCGYEVWRSGLHYLGRYPTLAAAQEAGERHVQQRRAAKEG